MNPTFTDKLYTNFANSWKMFSVWGSGVFAVAVAYFLSLPQDAKGCAATAPDCLTQTAVLSHLPLSGTTISVILGFVVYYLRIHPQSNITPAVAAAKSDSPNQGTT